MRKNNLILIAVVMTLTIGILGCKKTTANETKTEIVTEIEEGSSTEYEDPSKLPYYFIEGISNYSIYTPNIEVASLTDNDKAILDKNISKYTAFTIDKKELTEYLSNNGGYGYVRFQFDENFAWTIYLEINPMRLPGPDWPDYFPNTFKGETSYGQHVRFTIDENNVFGIIFYARYHYVIMDAKEYTQNREDETLIVYKSWDIIPDGNVYYY